MLAPQTPPDDASEVMKDLDRRFRKPLAIYFRRRLAGRSDDAEDLTQEVFLRLARRPDQNNGETLEAYVFKIAASVLADWRRKRATHKSDAHENLDHVMENVTFPSVFVEDRSPDRVLAGKEALRRLETALAELSERTRNIFLLYRLGDVQQADIARRLGISVSTVEREIQKAMLHLGKSFL